MRDRKTSDPESPLIRGRLTDSDRRKSLSQSGGDGSSKTTKAFWQIDTNRYSICFRSYTILIINANTPSTIDSVITIALVALCILASLDLWRQYALNSDEYWFTGYRAAVRSSDFFWKLGFHIEDLEQKISFQRKRFESIRHAVGVLHPPLRHSTDTFTKRRNMQNAVHRLVGNDTSVLQLRCQDLQSTSGGDILRVGKLVLSISRNLF